MPYRFGDVAARRRDADRQAPARVGDAFLVTDLAIQGEALLYASLTRREVLLDGTGAVCWSECEVVEGLGDLLDAARVAAA